MSSITMAVTRMRCLIETDEVGDDEPYILVTGINLKTPIPNVEVTKYGPWKDAAAGDLLTTQPIPNGFNPEHHTIHYLASPMLGPQRKTSSY